MLQEDTFFRPTFGEQIPSHPGLYQVIPWELTKSGNFLKNKDPQVQVRAMTVTVLCVLRSPNVLCCAVQRPVHLHHPSRGVGVLLLTRQPALGLLLYCCRFVLLLYCCQRVKLYFVGLHSAEPHEVDMTRVYSFDSDTRELVSHTPKVLGADDLSSMLDPVMRIRWA